MAADRGQVGASAEMLGVGRRDVGAVAAAHQHAILRTPEIGDFDREPDAHPGQNGGKDDGSGIRQHTVPIVVRFRAFELRQVRGGIFAKTRCVGCALR